MSFSYEDADRIVKEQELKKFTDDDLLLELRRRKRLARVEADHVISGMHREFGHEPPRDYILPRMMREAGYEVGTRLLRGEFKIPGMKEEEGYFDDRPRYLGKKDFRYFIPFNFVVEKP